MDVQGIFALILLLWMVGLILTIWALVDAIRVPDDSMYRAGTKLVWVLVILLGNLIGSIVYFAVGRPVTGTLRPPTAGVPPPVPPSLPG